MSRCFPQPTKNQNINYYISNDLMYITYCRYTMRYTVTRSQTIAAQFTITGAANFIKHLNLSPEWHLTPVQKLNL
jgi:hypothetical protein